MKGLEERGLALKLTIPKYLGTKRRHRVGWRITEKGMSVIEPPPPRRELFPKRRFKFSFGKSTFQLGSSGKPMGKTMNPKTKTPKCTNCGSTETKLETPRWQDSDFRWQPASYRCEDCDYVFTEDLSPELKPDWDAFVKGG